LDVGCADLEIVKDLAFKNYTGIDISASIVAKDHLSKPGWNFIEGDFLTISLSKALKADLVICLDILIHQHDYRQYLEFVRAVVESINSLGLVNGFQSFPRAHFVSEIAAYHEPITRTLRKAGIRAMEVIGSYRDTQIVLFTKKKTQTGCERCKSDQSCFGD
jgi:2-polyprenyl-3-methyl-5-hydroxy-6-metoxy-1,4-benzoquinol methylase